MFFLVVWVSVFLVPSKCIGEFTFSSSLKCNSICSLQSVACQMHVLTYPSGRWSDHEWQQRSRNMPSRSKWYSETLFLAKALAFRGCLTPVDFAPVFIHFSKLFLWVLRHLSWINLTTSILAVIVCFSIPVYITFSPFVLLTTLLFFHAGASTMPVRLSKKQKNS